MTASLNSVRPSAFCGSRRSAHHGGSHRRRRAANSTVIVDDRYALKIYRRLSEGTSIRKSKSALSSPTSPVMPTPPPLLGTHRSRWKASSDRRSASCMASSTTRAMPGRIPPLVSTVSWRRNVCLRRTPREPDRHAEAGQPHPVGGRRTGITLALGSHDDIPASSRSDLKARDIAAWTEGLVASANEMFDQLAPQRFRLSIPNCGTWVEHPCSPGAAKRSSRIKTSVIPPDIDASQDPPPWRLPAWEQLLVVGDDVFIIDFEGEPKRPEGPNGAARLCGTRHRGLRSFTGLTPPHRRLDGFVAASAEELERFSRTLDPKVRTLRDRGLSQRDA